MDIVPELLERIQTQFEERLTQSSTIKKIEKLVSAGKATYAEAQEYAVEVGEILARCFKDNITPGILPDGKMYYNIAERILNATLGHNYELISAVTSEIQKQLNQQARISIKPQIPPKNQDRIDGIIEKVCEPNKKYEETKWAFDEPVVNCSQSIVDDFVYTNADLHYKAGLSPKIIRTTTGKCCDWCDSLAGVYDYYKVKNTGNDVFRRHRFCKCTVEYIPADGKMENVWTHKTPGSDEDRAIRQKHEQRWKEKQTESSIKRRELIED